MSSSVVHASRQKAGASIADFARSVKTAVEACAIILAVVIAAFSVAYTFLIYPQADDLERTGAMRVFSPGHRVFMDWLGENGRWASLRIAYAFYSTGNIIRLYPFALTLLLLLALAGCCCFTAVVSRRRISERAVIGSGIAAYSFIWLSIPRGEMYYWIPAAIEYLLPLSMGMIVLWLLYGFHTRWSKIVAVVLSFFVPALHDVFGGWIVPVLALTWFVRVRRRKPEAGVAGWAALAGALGMASVEAAPGIRHRVQTMAPHHISFPHAWKQAFHIEGIILGHWAAILPVLVVILLTAARVRRRPPWYDAAPRLTKASLLLAMAPVPICLLAVINYGLGGSTAPRVYDGFYWLFAAAAATFAAALGFDLAHNSIGTFLQTPVGSLVRSGVVMLAVIGAVSLPRFRAMFKDIDPAIRNRAVWLQRDHEIWAQKRAGVRDVVASQHMLPLTILPSYLDLHEEDVWYINQQLSTYYGVRTIRLSTIDEILDQLPAGVSQLPPVPCNFAIDSINGRSPGTLTSPISKSLRISGWMVISAKEGIVPDENYVTLSKQGQTLYIKTRPVYRPDLKAAFHQPELPDAGFKANIDLSNLDGEYSLGMARVYDGKMASCSQYRIPLTIQPNR